MATLRYVPINTAHATYQPCICVFIYGIVGKVKFIFQIMQIKRKEIFTKLLIKIVIENCVSQQNSANFFIMQQTCSTFLFSLYRRRITILKRIEEPTKRAVSAVAVTPYRFPFHLLYEFGIREIRYANYRQALIGEIAIRFLSNLITRTKYKQLCWQTHHSTFVSKAVVTMKTKKACGQSDACMPCLFID